MNGNLFTEAVLIERLGWTLVHSVWQIALVALLLWFALRLIRHERANVRYAVSVFALAAAAALPAITFFQSTTNSFGAAEITFTNKDRPESIGNSGEPTLNAAAGSVTGISSSLNDGQNMLSPITDFRSFLNEKFPSLFPAAVALWLFGVMLFSLRLAGGIWKLNQMKTIGIQPLNEEWKERFNALCKFLNIKKVRLFRSETMRTPIAVGFLRPLIIVPAGLFLQMDPRQLESIIAHELIHIRRYDPLLNIIQSVAETLFFYHPALWWISGEIRREREFAADAAVIAAYSDDGIIYASALANLEEIRLLANVNVPSIATAANGGNLMQRIQRILNDKTEISHANSAWSAGVAFVLISAVLLGILSFTPSSLVNAQKLGAGDKKIALGFVSIPPLDRTANAPKDSDATARLIISKLQQNKIPAIGFVQGSMISDGDKLFPVRANIVKLWHDAGLEVGIGNFKHIWFYHTPYDEYVAGVEKNEATVKKLLGDKAQIRYFSYPFLNTGKSAEERDRFEQWLSARGLRSAKYTIDNQEWMYSYAYEMARLDNDINTMNEVRIAFLRYMDKMFDHYEAYSQELFGRNIPQTMVLTPSRLIADSADELFLMIQKRGYSFVSMDEALSDQAYKTSENMFGKFGTSWMERWTHSQGKKLRKEPAVDADVETAWKERDVKK